MYTMYPVVDVLGVHTIGEQPVTEYSVPEVAHTVTTTAPSYDAEQTASTSKAERDRLASAISYAGLWGGAMQTAVLLLPSKDARGCLQKGVRQFSSKTYADVRSVWGMHSSHQGTIPLLGARPGMSSHATACCLCENLCEVCP